MSAARRLARICWPDKEQCRPVVARVIVLLSSSSKVPEVQHSNKVQVSRDIGKMMVILPLSGQDISRSISKAGKMSSISWSSSRKK
jgi:hypothetical protein